MKAGVLVHISEVARGMACCCYCVGCAQSLVARKGHERRHHFAHLSHSTCDGGLETILHRLAKEAFLTIPTVRVPEYRLRLERKLQNDRVVRHRALIAPERIVRIDSVRIEPRLQEVIPDVVITTAGRELLIEIAVTHACDRMKLRALRRSSLPTLEIRLSTEDAWLSRDELRAKLADDHHCKSWIFHPGQRAVERAFCT